ncbi:hypothetical protein [Sphingomonas sp.]|uniref:hypothetical protein n=1 Tax=Sphingomonas sp. TaxID=28214 RepID=UPI001B09868C|nr:hypothetical protein [Sphingomonas sp.]MBO9715212.1 hypothetical protein [Sphingomonas sp.]
MLAAALLFGTAVLQAGGAADPTLDYVGAVGDAWVICPKALVLSTIDEARLRESGFAKSEGKDAAAWTRDGEHPVVYARVRGADTVRLVVFPGKLCSIGLFGPTATVASEAYATNLAGRQGYEREPEAESGATFHAYGRQFGARRVHVRFERGAAAEAGVVWIRVTQGAQ